MKKIGITGSLASGKSTAIKILGKKGPVFSADNIVKKLYSHRKIKKYISKKLKIQSSFNLKSLILGGSKNAINLDNSNIPIADKQASFIPILLSFKTLIAKL